MAVTLSYKLGRWNRYRGLQSQESQALPKASAEMIPSTYLPGTPSPNSYMNPRVVIVVNSEFPNLALRFIHLQKVFLLPNLKLRDGIFCTRSPTCSLSAALQFCSFGAGDGGVCGCCPLRFQHSVHTWTLPDCRDRENSPIPDRRVLQGDPIHGAHLPVRCCECLREVSRSRCTASSVAAQDLWPSHSRRLHLQWSAFSLTDFFHHMYNNIYIYIYTYIYVCPFNMSGEMWNHHRQTLNLSNMHRTLYSLIWDYFGILRQLQI